MVLRLAQASAYHRHRTGASERAAEEILVRQPDHCQGRAAPPKTEISSKTTGVFEAWLHLVPMCTTSEPSPLRIIAGPVKLVKSLHATPCRWRGSRTVNSVKSPTSLSTVMVPPCCCVTIS